MAVLPLVACRLLYGVVTLLKELDLSSHSFTPSLAIRVCFNVVPEMIVTVVLLVVGISTHNISTIFRPSELEKRPAEV